MEVHGNYVVAAGGLEHVGHQFRCDGGAGFVFLILASVGEVREDGGDAAGGRSFAGVDHDEEFHEPVVYVVGPGGLEDEY